MTSNAHESFTALDWIAVVLTAALIFATAMTPLTVSQTFLELFTSFGDESELPFLTRISLSPWYGLLTPILPLAMLLWGAASRGAILSRRVAVVAAFVLALGILGLYLFGAYAPILAIVDAVGP